MRETIRALLAADPMLASILTGDVHTEVEISRTLTPTAFDEETQEILPCALVKLPTEQPAGPIHTGSRLFLEVYFYQRAGYDAIDQAKDRVYVLLHRQRINYPATRMWEIRHTDDVSDQEDQALLCSLALSRYEILRNRVA